MKNTIEITLHYSDIDYNEKDFNGFKKTSETKLSVNETIVRMYVGRRKWFSSVYRDIFFQNAEDAYRFISNINTKRDTFKSL